MAAVIAYRQVIRLVVGTFDIKKEVGPAIDPQHHVLATAQRACLDDACKSRDL